MHGSMYELFRNQLLSAEDVSVQIPGIIMDYTGNHLKSQAQEGEVVTGLDGTISQQYMVTSIENGILYGIPIPHSVRIEADAYRFDKTQNKFLLLKRKVEPSDLLSEELVEEKDILLFTIPNTSVPAGVMSGEYNDPYGLYFVGVPFSAMDGMIDEILDDEDEDATDQDDTSSDDNETSEDDEVEDDDDDLAIVAATPAFMYMNEYGAELKLLQKIADQLNSLKNQ